LGIAAVLDVLGDGDADDHDRTAARISLTETGDLYVADGESCAVVESAVQPGVRRGGRAEAFDDRVDRLRRLVGGQHKTQLEPGAQASARGFRRSGRQMAEEKGEVAAYLEAAGRVRHGELRIDRDLADPPVDCGFQGPASHSGAGISACGK